LWNDSAAGSPLGSGRADANAIAAPLSFFAAVANGIALARSEVYRDQYGRRLSDYTNGALFAVNTVNWANGSLSNGLAAPGNTFNLFLRDDSTIAGDIEPSALSTNILRIDTAATLEVTNSITNITRLFINGGARIPTAWRDATVSNSTLTFPAGSGKVVLIGKASVRHSTVVSNGVFTVNGELTGGGAVTVARGSLQGHGKINGAVSALAAATLAPGSAIGTLTIQGPLNVAGTTVMEIKKNGDTLTNDLVAGIDTFTAGGILIVVASGDALATGDRFRLIVAATYAGSFAAIHLPPLRAGLEWNTSRLTLDGSIEVK
jgi:hypothetical protein